MTQPRINWWRGNLRPYESTDSFVARFGELNRLPTAKVRQYFRDLLEPSRVVSLEEIDWFARELNEPLEVVQSVLAPALNLTNFGKFRPPASTPGATIRFCPRCIRLGYHSNLHEERWLERCIFHGEPLQISSPPLGTGVLLSKRIKVLKQLMRDHCTSWPRSAPGNFKLDREDSFQRFALWLQQTRTIFSGISESTIWTLDDGASYGSPPVSQLFGQFHALNPVPEIIRACFVSFDDDWGADVRRFPVRLKDEVARVSQNLGFTLVYSLFKQVCMQAPLVRAFRKRHTQELEALADRHTKCECKWGLTRNFGVSWQTVDPEGWPHWGYECPYEVAKRDLEISMGGGLDFMSRRQAEDAKLQLFRFARELADLGLIGCTPDAIVSADGYAYYPQEWPCFEWAGDHQLTVLLDAIAEFEASARWENTKLWLKSLESGGHPYRRNTSRTDIALSVSEETLTLLRWYRRAPLPTQAQII